MSQKERAQFGFGAFSKFKGNLPNPFPRIMGPNAVKYVTEVVESGLSCDMLGRFERTFAEDHGVKYCVSAPGCSNALLSLAEGLNFKPGDEVIVSPITDYGTFMGLCKCGYIPVFADTAPGSINVSAETIEPCITDRTRAILVVHKTGLMCDMDPIMELAKKHNLMVIEDCCQAIYSTYKGRKAGTIGDVGAFSFDSEKTMGSDIGGCFITNNEELFNYTQYFCLSRGAEMKPGFGRLHVVAGSAMRMPSCTAAINLAQFEMLPETVAIRDRQIRKIQSLLMKIPGIYVEEPSADQEVYSCWMAGFHVDLDQFDCTLEEFAQDCVDAGFTGLGTAYYYLAPVACTFLSEAAAAKKYPFSPAETEHTFSYDESQYPNAVKYLSNFLRWCTFCEKYTDEDCEHVYEIVKAVADAHRK